MPTFASKPKPGQESKPESSEKPGGAFSGHSHEVTSILELQRMEGVQAAQRLADGGAEDRAGGDASRVPLYLQGRAEGNIPEQLRTKMEDAFEADFSGVSVQENSAIASDLDAIAYTQGDEIHFAPGYDPYSTEGQEYLAHELSHVLQQRSGRVKTTHQELDYNVSSDTGLESEADNAGRKAARGQKVGLNLNRGNHLQNAAVQKKDAPLQLVREPIPASSFILDVNASADTVLSTLISTAYATSRQASDVNWRRIFYPAIESQIRGKQLGSISHSWTDYTGIDCDWEVSISFYMDQVVPTGRNEQRSVTTTQGGSSSPSLGSSQSSTQSSGVKVGGEANVEGGKVSGGVEAGGSTTQGHSQGAGGGISGGQSQSSTESVSRYTGNLYVDIDIRASASYSNWDIINPVKWGAHLAGTQHQRANTRIGTITFDRPSY